MGMADIVHVNMLIPFYDIISPLVCEWYPSGLLQLFLWPFSMTATGICHVSSNGAEWGPQMWLQSHNTGGFPENMVDSAKPKNGVILLKFLQSQVEHSGL